MQMSEGKRESGGFLRGEKAGLVELGDPGERQADARAHRTAQATVRAVAGRFV